MREKTVSSCVNGKERQRLSPFSRIDVGQLKGSKQSGQELGIEDLNSGIDAECLTENRCFHGPRAFERWQLCRSYGRDEPARSAVHADRDESDANGRPS